MRAADAPEAPEYARFKRRWRGGRNQILAALAGILAFYLAVDVVFFPWDYRWPGHPALTGDWQADLVVDGRPARMVFRLGSGPGGRRHSMGKTLIVDAKLCDATTARNFHGTSKPRGWSGDSFGTSLHARDERPGGFRQISLEARWDRADALEIRARLAEQPSTVSTYEGASPAEFPIVSATLHRGAARMRNLPCEIR